MTPTGQGAGRAGRRASLLASLRRPGGDDGITLIEVMVSTSLIAVVGSLFAGGIVQAYRLGAKNESMTAVQAELHNVFSRMEKQVRYASSISEPGDAHGNHYVEFVTSSTGTVVCTQYRVAASTATLQSRTWRQGEPPGAWSTLASNVTSPTAFERTVAAPNGPQHQRLTVQLSLMAGKGSTATSKRSAVTYTALNTSLDTDGNHNACQAMGRP